jgi:outer membrane lipoprotein-sorting protein
MEQKNGKQMKKVFLTTIILISYLFVLAQEDEKAIQILNQVSSKTRSFKTIEAEFSFTMDNNEVDIHEENEGTIKLKGEKYQVVLPGAGLKIYSDGETIWNYMEDGNQVTISTIEEGNSDLMNPSSLFSIYEKGFQSKFIEEKKEGNKTLYIIELYPDNEFQDISKISLAINASTLMIDSATLYGTDDNLYGIHVKKMETNKSFPDSEFVFNATEYDDIEIIDFR